MSQQKENKIGRYSINYALLSVQTALLGVVTRELRAVVVNIDEENKVFYIHFYYDGSASETLIDLWDCAITEVDLGTDFFCEKSIERLDFPQKIPVTGELAYLRKE